MSQNFNLIKTGVIDFTSLILDKYALVGLNETEVIVLIKLNNFLKTAASINLEELPSELKKSMQLSEKEIGNVIANLIETKFIDLIEMESEVKYSLDLTYKHLANILDGENEKSVEETNANDIKKIVAIIEKEFGSLLNPLDLEMVRNWINVDKYEFDEVNTAILDTLKRKRKSVKAVNEILKAKKAKENIPNRNDDSLQELFNNVYGKIKG